MKDEKANWEKLCNECSEITQKVGWTKEDTKRVIAEARELEAKANKYDSLVEKIKEEMKNKEWATKGYDCSTADYKQSQDIGAWIVLQKILDTEK